MRLLFLLLLLSGCGYRWQPDFPAEKRPLIYIPYVTGDSDGTFTSELAQAVIGSGMAELCHRGGDYRLQVAIIDTETHTVGYRRDRQKVTGKVKKNIVAREGRKTITVEAALYQGDEIAYGPYQIAADADYDYLDGDSIQDLVFINSAGVPTTALAFSLGQLESVESAQEAANRPLNQKLAQKIVDVIFSEW